MSHPFTSQVKTNHYLLLGKGFSVFSQKIENNYSNIFKELLTLTMMILNEVAYSIL